LNFLTKILPTKTQKSIAYMTSKTQFETATTFDTPNQQSDTLALQVLPPAVPAFPGDPHPAARCAQPPALRTEPAPVHPPSPRKITRNGKIAHLPFLERDMVNRMLFNHVGHSKIVEALAEHDFRVTQRNVSNWKTRGGYREWRLAQDQALQLQLRQDNLTGYLRKHDASQVPEVGLQLGATQLSEFLLRPEAEQLLATDPEKYAKTIATLCRLTSQIHALQKYRDDSAKELGRSYNPERVQREAQAEIELTRSLYSAEKLGRSAQEADTPHHNYLPKDA
jgi:hypothetical protein